MRTAPRTRTTAPADDAARTPGPRPVPAERRTRPRLRELCDEVLASFRVARERDLLSADEREQAHRFLDRLTPTAPLGR